MTLAKEEKPRVLVLLRHAKSSWRDSELGDRDRPLNARGDRAGRLLAAYFARQPPPDLVLCSSALRTRETFAHIARAYSAPPPVLMEDGLYLADARAIMQRIEAVPDSVEFLLVIGHNPGLHELASMLARHGTRRDRNRLADKMTDAFDRVWSVSAEKKITLRQSAMVAAIREVASALEARGIYP